MTDAAFLEKAWGLVEDPEAMLKFYRSTAKKDAAVELALARWEFHDSEGGMEAKHSLEETKDLIAPLATSELFGERARWATRNLIHFGTARTAAIVRDMLPKVVGPELRAGLAEVLAEIGTEADFGLLHGSLDGPSDDDDEEAPIGALFSLARRGDQVARQRLLARAQTFFDTWKTGTQRYSSGDWPRPFAMITALGECRLPEAVPLLIDYLSTPCVIHALAGLEAIKDPRARTPVRELLAELQGEVPRILPYRLGAQAVLHALGEPQDLTSARAVFETAIPKRYGWPKLEHVYELKAQALHALRTRGTKKDIEYVASFATAFSSAMRTEAAAAAAQLGRTLTLRCLDVPYLRWLARHDGLGAVKKLLDAPGALYSYNVPATLFASKDASAKTLALKWALRVVEGQVNYRIEDFYGSEPEIDTAITILKGFKKTPAVVNSKSAWVRQALFDQKPPEAAAPPPSIGKLTAHVERVDRAPFVFGSKINGVALDAAGQRLAVVMGDAVGCIADAHTGALLTQLQVLYRWAYDCAFSNDGSLLAVAYHGGHLVLFNAHDGRLVHEFKGFGGVPNGVKRLAFSPDGRFLAAGGSDGSARLFELKSKKQLWAVQCKGSFEAVLFTPDSSKCLFSHVKIKDGQPNELHVLEVAKKKAKVVKMPSSMWALAFDSQGHLWAGGEGKEVLQFDAKFKPVRGGSLKQAQVVRLGWAADQRLVAVSQTGEAAIWNTASRKKARAIDPANKAALWALATSPSTLYLGGDQGIVHRFDSTGAAVGALPGVVHLQQLRGFVTLADGTLITGAWDGKLLRWKKGAGVGELLFDHGSRFNAIAGSTDGKRIYCAADGQVIIHDLAAGTQQVVKVKSQRAEDICVRDGRVAVAMGGGQVHLFDETKTGLALRWTCEKAAGEALTVAITEAGTVLYGTAKGGIGELDSKGAIGWTKREHGLDLIDKDPLGSPHRDVVGLDTAGELFASLSNDDTLRLFEVKSKKRRLRAFVDGGLFNNCVFSPDGRWVVGSCSAGLNVFDTATGEHLCEVTYSAFTSSTARTIVAFSGPTDVLVGTENGNIYRVTFS